MPVRSISTSTFNEDVLKSEGTVLVDFWAPWCPPCRAVAPILDDLARHHGPKLEVLKINVDENPELAQKYQVESIPAFKVFQKGIVVDSFLGAMPREAFESRLSAFIA